MTEDRHWIDNIADLISGRMHNTLVSLLDSRKAMENQMTQNEQLIRNAAQNLSNFKTQLDEGIEALLAKIDATPGVDREDLSDEIEMLTGAVEGIGQTAGRLTPAPAGTPANQPPTNAADEPPIGGPISHEEIPPTPLAGASGGTDAGVPTVVNPPGTNPPDTPTTPLAEDAQVEANPTLGASDDGSGSNSETPGGETGALGTDDTPNTNAEDEGDADTVEDDDDGDADADEFEDDDD